MPGLGFLWNGRKPGYAAFPDVLFFRPAKGLLFSFGFFCNCSSSRFTDASESKAVDGEAERLFVCCAAPTAMGH